MPELVPLSSYSYDAQQALSVIEKLESVAHHADTSILVEKDGKIYVDLEALEHTLDANDDDVVDSLDKNIKSECYSSANEIYKLECAWSSLVACLKPPTDEGVKEKLEPHRILYHDGCAIRITSENPGSNQCADWADASCDLRDEATPNQHLKEIAMVHVPALGAKDENEENNFSDSYDIQSVIPDHAYRSMRVSVSAMIRGFYEKYVSDRTEERSKQTHLPTLLIGGFGDYISGGYRVENPTGRFLNDRSKVLAALKAAFPEHGIEAKWNHSNTEASKTVADKPGLGGIGVISVTISAKTFQVLICVENPSTSNDEFDPESFYELVNQFNPDCIMLTGVQPYANTVTRVHRKTTANLRGNGDDADRLDGYKLIENGIQLLSTIDSKN